MDKKNLQKGSIIIYTLLILIAVIVIAIALIRLLLPKFASVRESIYSTVAIYAADSGLEWCLYSNRVDPTVRTIPPQITTLSTVQAVTIQYYNGAVSTTCPYNTAVSFRIVGSFRNISRSLEIF